jgi:hypothetical protein
MTILTNYESTVNSFYLAFYGRPADPSGLKFWSKALADNNGDAGTIIQAFATSDEAQTRFGSDTIGARITDIYEQLFSRAPDAAGLAFWTDAVEQGNATLAEVSLAILKGAQGSDDTMSTMRQKAADAFTIAVEDGSTQYSGFASIEAARVLVRAVTLDATEADLANLVKAAVSFADTATKNPKVVEAIATGSTLLNLYDTDRGTKDPVALTQALADTAKAAAGDPVTLESLLRGGGMDKVLKVMPAKATLGDVVEALAKGGLPAAVEVVYPTAPTAPVVTPKPTPATSMELKFDSVSQGKFDTNKKDTVTNVEVATVKFSYTGSDLASGQTLQYSTDGVTWRSDNMSVDKEINFVTITGVDLTGHSNKDLVGPKLTILGGEELVANVFTKIQLQAVDASKSVISKAETVIEFDNTAPTKSLYYISLSDDAKPALLFGQYGGIEGLVQWRLNSADSKWTDVTRFNEDGGFALTGIDLSKTGQRLEMRVIDAAGNVGYTSSQDVKGPAQPLDFKLIPTAQGLQIESNQPVEVRLQLDVENEVVLGEVSGNTDNGGSMIGAQGFDLGGGELKIARVGELDAVTVEGVTYAFGTNGRDLGALHGEYVWGFDGDDLIYGTFGKNYLVGGAGADQIFLMENSQGSVDTLVFAKGDTATGVYAGGPITLDKVKGAGPGDVIQLDKVFTAAPVIGSTFLANENLNQVAIVRGVLATDGNFEPGSDEYHQDYMIQWSDGETVNSIMLEDYGVVAPALTVDVLKGTMTLAKPGEQTETVTQPPQDSATPPNTDTPVQNPNDPSGPSAPNDPNQPVTAPPYVKTSMKADGVQLETNVIGQLESTSINGSLVPVQTRDGSSLAHPGGVSLGAQQSVISGVITVKTAQGNITDNVQYTLGTNTGDGDLHGQNVWGFDGYDFITGTRDDDFLVGGKGGDWIDLGLGGNDTVVIGQGDTATNVSMSNEDTVSMAGMDVILNAGVGDTIQVSALFAEARVENNFLTDGGTHKLALLQGQIFEDTFVVDNSEYATSYLLQWSDGDNVNSVVLASFGHDAPVLEVDDRGTITFIGVNQEVSQGIPGG